MNASFLFAGVHFDKKRFATDFAKFNSSTEDGIGPPSPTSTSKRERESVEQLLPCKRKKKKQMQQGKISGEGRINIFKPPQHSADGDGLSENSPMQQRKDEAANLEFMTSLRKAYRIHVSGHNVPTPLTGFQDLASVHGCPSYLMKNITKAEYKEPTAIQRQAITVLLSGRECFACAPTGSGKTLAFVIPILMKLNAPSKDGIRAVILCPTRELAKQISMEFKILAKGRKFRIRLMTKALSRCADFKSLPCDVLVTTPLRLDHVLKQSRIDLSFVEHLVLDESDKLFELGFVEQIDSVVNACSNPQIIRSLFSATLPDAVEELARSIMHDAVRILIGEKNTASQTIKQKLLYVGSEEGKRVALRQIFQESLQPPLLLFVQSKERAKELYKELVFEHFHVDCIHADLTQAQRELAVNKFREGKTWVLIATDLLARGMDFKGVNCVINFDFPSTTASYIHRVGRSGRAGRPGEAITFYTEDDAPFLRSIVNVLVASGGAVPLWMLNLPKPQKKKHNRSRKPISVQRRRPKRNREMA